MIEMDNELKLFRLAIEKQTVLGIIEQMRVELFRIEAEEKEVKNEQG